MTGSLFLSPSLAMTQFVLFIPIGADSAESLPHHIHQIGQPLERPC